MRLISVTRGSLEPYLNPQKESISISDQVRSNRIMREIVMNSIMTVMTYIMNECIMKSLRDAFSAKA